MSGTCKHSRAERSRLGSCSKIAKDIMKKGDRSLAPDCRLACCFSPLLDHSLRGLSSQFLMRRWRALIEVCTRRRSRPLRWSASRHLLSRTMVLKPLEFSECLADTPWFRQNLHEHEVALEDAYKSIKNIETQCRELISCTRSSFQTAHFSLV